MGAYLTVCMDCGILIGVVMCLFLDLDVGSSEDIVHCSLGFFTFYSEVFLSPVKYIQS